MRSSRQVYGKRSGRLTESTHESFATLNDAASSRLSNSGRLDKANRPRVVGIQNHATLATRIEGAVESLVDPVRSIRLSEDNHDEQRKDNGAQQESRARPRAKAALGLQNANINTPGEPVSRLDKNNSQQIENRMPIITHESSVNSKPQRTSTPAEQPVRKGRVRSAAAKRILQEDLDRHSQDTSRRTVKKDELPLPIRSTGKVFSRNTLIQAQPLLELYEDEDRENGLMSFQQYADALCSQLRVIKIAEASYSEVYRLSTHANEIEFSEQKDSVLKIIPLKPHSSTLKKGRINEMSSVQDVASEVRLLKHMADIPGYAVFRDIKVLQGTLPTQFLAAWRHYDKHVRKCESPDPVGEGVFNGEKQLWAALEMQDAGEDLQWLEELHKKPHKQARSDKLEDVRGIRSQMHTIWACWDVFWNITIALAKGEEVAYFEHRDLHLGNICLRRNTNWSAHEALHQIDLTRNLNFTGIETTLIDYTLSRAALKTSEDTSEVIYFDLFKNMSIFRGVAKDDYQYQIYRYMRNLVSTGDSMQKSQTTKTNRSKSQTGKASKKAGDSELENRYESPWFKSCLTTNILWLHLILYKLANHMEWPSSKTAQAAGTKNLQEYYDKSKLLEKRLREVMELLQPAKIKHNGLNSASNLVCWAKEKQWFTDDDIGLQGD